MALAIEFPQVVWSIEFGGDETVVRQVTMTGGGGAGGGGVTVHNDLTGRSDPDTHPISSITGLSAALAAAGNVDSVNGQTGTVVLDAADVGALSDSGGGKDAVSSLGALTGTVSIDLANGNSFYGTLSGNTTFTMTGFTTGRECQFVLSVTQDSTPRSVTWPAAVKWPFGSVPAISTGSGSRDLFVFRSRDGGTTVDGFQIGKGMA